MAPPASSLNEDSSALEAKRHLTAVSLISSLLFALGSSIDVAFGEYLVAAIDIGGFLNITACYLYFRITGRHVLVILYLGVIGLCTTQPLVSIVLGGFHESGGRVLWCVSGVCALLIWDRNAKIALWVVICITEIAIVWLIGDAFRLTPTSQAYREFMWLFNGGGLLFMLLFMLIVFSLRLRKEQDNSTALMAEIESVNQRMMRDIDAAVDYVLSLIPEPDYGDVTFKWSYIPATSLGGDTFGFHRIDDSRVAIYLIDVTGHGLDSAFLSVTIINLIRSESLPEADFSDPSSVLHALNERFQGGKQNHKLFTIWYGVINTKNSTLRWAGAGHPDAMLIERGSRSPSSLPSTGMMIGVLQSQHYPTLSVPLSQPARIYVYSDGVYEIAQEDGERWKQENLVQFIYQLGWEGSNVRDEVLAHVRRLKGSTRLNDDFTLLEVNYHRPGSP